MTRSCGVDGCDLVHEARGFCSKHYQRWKKYGDPLGGGPFLTGDPQERFWPKVDKNGPGGCWLWLSPLDHEGYGMFRMNTHQKIRPHRACYIFLVGPIPDGLQLDHLCRVRHCVNPDHLEPVTPQENTRRSTLAESNRRRMQERTACRSGHPYDEENTAWWSGKRVCRTCARERARAGHKRRAAVESVNDASEFFAELGKAAHRD